MTCTICDASRYVIPSTPPWCTSLNVRTNIKTSSNIPHLTCVPSNWRLFSQTLTDRLGARQADRVEPNGSDNHLKLSALAPPWLRRTLETWRGGKWCHLSGRRKWMQLEWCWCHVLLPVKVLTVIWPLYFFHSGHFTLFRTSACDSISNNTYTVFHDFRA